MQPPVDFMRMVHDAATLLWSLGRELRAEAEKAPDRAELWLSTRDFEGLATRLGDADEWQWRNGFASLVVGGQDLAVLDEILLGSALMPRSLTSAEQNVLRSLRQFLHQATNGSFKFDEPA